MGSVGVSLRVASAGERAGRSSEVAFASMKGVRFVSWLVQGLHVASWPRWGLTCWPAVGLLTTPIQAREALRQFHSSAFSPWNPILEISSLRPPVQGKSDFPTPGLPSKVVVRQPSQHRHPRHHALPRLTAPVAEGKPKGKPPIGYTSRKRPSTMSVARRAQKEEATEMVKLEGQKVHSLWACEKTMWLLM